MQISNSSRCGGKEQSPIAIFAEDLIVNKSLPELNLTEYEQVMHKYNLIIDNNGHSFEVVFNNFFPEAKVYVSSGGLESWYSLTGFHFHWSQDNEHGMEHHIGNADYPLVAHFVHTKEGMYFDEAIKHRDGIAVIAVPFRLSKDDNEELNKISGHLSEVDNYGQLESLGESFKLRNLLPEDTSNFFRYHGSLTTPPCVESVVWTIFTDTSFVSVRQLQQFRRLRNQEGLLKYNFRPTKKLNGRKVQVRKYVWLPKRGGAWREKARQLLQLRRTQKME